MYRIEEIIYIVINPQMSYKIHKNTKLTPALRMGIWNKYKTWKVSQLACMYNISRPIYIQSYS